MAEVFESKHRLNPNEKKISYAYFIPSINIGNGRIITRRLEKQKGKRENILFFFWRNTQEFDIPSKKNLPSAGKQALRLTVGGLTDRNNTLPVTQGPANSFSRRSLFIMCADILIRFSFTLFPDINLSLHTGECRDRRSAHPPCVIGLASAPRGGGGRSSIC